MQIFRLFTPLLLIVAVGCYAQESPAQQQPIGRTSASLVQVSGAVEMDHGEMLLGNGSTITAGTQTVKIALTRGGSLRLCSTTSVHLAKDRSIPNPADSALMMALDRGALEANYLVGKYSDVLLTPDLRILISGPGEVNLSIRVNAAGDTCVDNHGANAPYVTVSSQLEGGAYRVQPDQRVMFEQGSLREVVDREPEPCGCPPAPVTAVAGAGVAPAGPAAAPGKPEGTAFPLAESEGLAAPPPPPAKPVVPAGVAHAEVTVPLSYNGETSPAAAAPQASATATGATPAPAQKAPETATAVTPSPTVSKPAAPPVPEVAVASEAAAAKTHGRFFHRLGHFFSRLFR